jgi:Cytochrome P460
MDLLRLHGKIVCYAFSAETQMQRIAGIVQRMTWCTKCAGPHTACMLTLAKAALLAVALVPLTAFIQDNAMSSVPQYTSDAQLKLPENYREWIYLSSGFDMSYSKAAMAGMQDHHTFDNVFVNPAAYKAFQKTGTWPDKTMLVLEVRGAEGRGSINQKGNYQSTVMGLEVHVKDEARFPGKWAFFGFDDDKAAKMIPTTADCYSCHAAHAAVDTTFVQFYPSLRPIAKSKQTLSAAYLKELPTEK